MTGSKLRQAKGSNRRGKQEGPERTVLGFEDDVAKRRLPVDSMMLKDFAHAMVHLEEDSEEGLVLEGDLEALQGVTSAVHAGEVRSRR